MDWKRIKTILILALIVINGILAYTFYQEKTYDRVEALDMSLILQDLADKNIIFDKVHLDVDYDIPNVELMIQSYDLIQADKVFRQHSAYDEASVDLLDTGVNQGKQLYFKTNTDRFSSPDTNDETIKQNAYDLIEQLGFSLDDVYLKNIGRTDKKTILQFGQKIEGHILRDAYMTIKYNNENLLSFERVWYDVVTVKDVEKQFSSKEYALYTFIGMIYDRFPDRKRPVEITDFSLVYNLSNEFQKMTLDNLAVEGEAVIYWQIETSDGETYIVDAIVE